MGVANRDLDSSEKNYVIDFAKNSASTNGLTLAVGLVKSPGQLRQVVVGCLGISGVPAVNVLINRWTSAGVTVISPGASIVISGEFGVSGSVFGETYAANSSLATLQVNDLLTLRHVGGTGAADNQLFAQFVIAATQDIKQSQDIK